MKPKEVRELVTMAIEGTGIVGYTEDEQKRKKRFLALGLKVVRELAERLGLKTDAKRARINPAGPAVSGDATLTTDDWNIILSHHQPRNTWGDVLVRRVDRSDRGRITPPVWIKWEELLDLDGLVGRLRKDKRLETPKPQERSAAE